MRSRLPTALLWITSLLLISTYASAQSVSCAGVPVWNATTTYVLGNKVVFNNTLYQVNGTLANVPPDYCPACGWYTNLGTCGTSPPPPPPPPPPPSGDGLSAILSRTVYEEMFPRHHAIFSYDALISAAASFPSFATQGTTSQRKQELAAFLGNIGHETTGGWPTAPGGPQAWGLYFAQEVGCENGQCTGYCVAVPEWPCAPGKTYHGRGPIQLSYNYNYGPAGRALGIDLLNNPERVATDGVVSFKTALWFWMTAQSPKPSAHAVMTGGWTPSSQDVALGRQPGFGMTINIINGGLECQRPTDARVNDRVAFYQRFTGMLGVGMGSNVYCDTMAHY